MFARYNRFSEWYDAKTYDQDIVPGDRDFYFEALKDEKDGVLELACGSGRLLKKFVEAGVEAWGLDLSMSLTTRGRKRLMLIPDSPFRLVEDDMTAFHIPRKFGAVFMAMNAFYYIPTLREKKKTLRLIKEHLRPKGRFVLDVMSSIKEIKKKGKISYGNERQPFGGGDAEFETGIRWNPKTKLAEEWLSYRLDLADWSVETGFDVDKLYFMEPKDLIKLLESSGFVVEETYGDFKKKKFSSKSKNLILVCRRK